MLNSWHNSCADILGNLGSERLFKTKGFGYLEINIQCHSCQQMDGYVIELRTVNAVKSSDDGKIILCFLLT